MSKLEQQHVMDTFRKQNKGILISTQMIEVGVDIKTATFMLILEAEYFGLSQLHQLRGRLGRGNLKGVCYLVSKKPNDERFLILENTSSGFEISEHDLYTRGPGDMLGLIQSGQPPFKHIDYTLDGAFIQKSYHVFQDIKNKDKSV
jgi:ATP-dependent DNA helicase RecG